jgi:hypothetical protein
VDGAISRNSMTGSVATVVRDHVGKYLGSSAVGQWYSLQLSILLPLKLWLAERLLCLLMIWD